MLLTPPDVAPNRRLVSLDLLALVLVALVALAFSIGYLHLLSRWWYEDDPGHQQRMMLIANPAAIFLDPAIQRHFGIGRAIVPMQILSQWIDARLFGANPLPVYAHSAVSLAATCMAVVLLLHRLTNDRLVAGLGGLLFLALPTTMAVHLFITARHYLEGFLFLILTIFLADRKQIWAALVVGGIAMLFKETYAATVLVFLFVHGLFHRDRREIVGTLLLGLFYFAYRLWVLGFDLSYSERPLAFGEIGIFLYGLAYSISASPAGVLIAFVAIFLTGMGLMQRTARRPIAIALAVFGVALISILPVATAVVITYQTPGTWYRVPFILAALLVIGLVWGAARLLPRPVALIVLVLAIALILPGTERTHQYWDGRMAAAEREGRFYLENPDKLLYSEEEAWWFIRGVHELYQVDDIHYLNAAQPTDPLTQPALARAPTIWRYRKGSFQPDDQLYQSLRTKNSP
jgi:hypothetical protein